MQNAIVSAAIPVRERSIADMTFDDVEVSQCVPKYGTLRTAREGIYFDHVNGTTMFWSAYAWQQVGQDEATAWGLIVPDGWITIVRHAYADRMRRRLEAKQRGLLV